MKRLLPFAALLALAACETTGPAPRPPLATGLGHDAFAWSNRTGANAIHGSVAYATKAAGRFTCADGSVALTPVAPASSDRTEKLYGSTEHAVATVEEVRSRSAGMAEPDYANYVRSTRCDTQGRFSFQGLPNGDWFLIARAKSSHGKGADVVIMRRVETRGGRAEVLELR